MPLTLRVVLDTASPWPNGSAATAHLLFLMICSPISTALFVVPVGKTGAACIGLLARETCTFGRTTPPAGILLYYGTPAAMLAWIDGSIELRIGQRIGSAARKTITMLQIRTITMLQIRTITMLQGVQGVRVPHLLSSPGAVLEMVGIKSAMAQIWAVCKGAETHHG